MQFMLFVYLNVEEMFHTKTFCYFPVIGFAENLKSLNNSFTIITLNWNKKKVMQITHEVVSLDMQGFALTVANKPGDLRSLFSSHYENGMTNSLHWRLLKCYFILIS